MQGEEGNLGSAEVGSEGSLDWIWKLWTKFQGVGAMARGKIRLLHSGLFFLLLQYFCCTVPLS